jgi:hypothetical protein
MAFQCKPHLSCGGGVVGRSCVAAVIARQGQDSGRSDQISGSLVFAFEGSPQEENRKPKLTGRAMTTYDLYIDGEDVPPERGTYFDTL